MPHDLIIRTKNRFFSSVTYKGREISSMISEINWKHKAGEEPFAILVVNAEVRDVHTNHPRIMMPHPGKMDELAEVERIIFKDGTEFPSG